MLYSPALNALVAAQPDKASISALLNTQLSSSRHVICKRDGNANAVDPWTTGTVFRNVNSTGTMGTTDGMLSDLGLLKGNNVAPQAADMFTGASVLRVENAADATIWMMGSLGPSKAAQLAAGIVNPVQFDFEVDGNFTTRNGISVRPGLAISGPRFAPSGVGPAAPDKTDDMIHTIELYDCTSSAQGVLVGSCNLDVRVDNFTLQHPRMAEQLGDAGYYRTSTGIIWGKHWFAPHLMISDKSCSLSGSAPLQELGICGSFKTDTGWTSYPASDTYTKRTDIVFPHAHKWVLKNKRGEVIDTIAMHDGKPINDPSLLPGIGTGYPVNGLGTGRPLQPRWNIGNIIIWRNDEPAFNPYGQHIYPGQHDLIHRPTQARSPFTILSDEPIITDGYSNNGSVNGLASYLWSSKWPLGLLPGQWGCFTLNGYTPPADQVPIDPYFDGSGSTNYGDSHAAWIEGWGYEPGAFGGHNWYTAPGGPRHDRSPIPSVIAEYLTDPTGVRPMGNVPWQTIATNWNMNYLNRSNHFFKDPRNAYFDTNFNQQYLWSQMGFYYSSGRETPGPKVLWLNGDQRGGTDSVYHFDVEGNNIWNAWAQDNLHDYATAAWGAISQKSHLLAFFAKCDWIIACTNHGIYGNNGSYGVRDWAWHCLHHVLMWIVASNHPDAVHQEDVEARWSAVMEDIYNNIYVPTWVDNNPSHYCAVLRALGQYGAVSGNGQPGVQGQGLAFYLGGVLVFMKQSGFWKKHIDRGGHLKVAMEMMISDYDRYAFGFLLDAKGKIWGGGGGYVNWPSNYVFPNGTNDPDNWLDVYNCRLAIASPDWPLDQGQADLFTGTDGSIRRDYDVAQWPLIQYTLMRPTYFPEYTHPRMNDAVTFVTNGLQRMKDSMTAWMAANPTGHAPDYIYAYAGVAPIKAPAVVGPI